MAIEHLSTLLCQKVITDEATGELTVIGMFSNIRATRGFPAVKTSMAIVMGFSGEPGDAYRITFEGPGGPTFEAGEGVIGGVPKLEHEFQLWAVQMIVQAEPAVFKSPGIYSVVLWSGDTEVHRYEFGVFPAEGETHPASQAVPEEAHIDG